VSTELFEESRHLAVQIVWALDMAALAFSRNSGEMLDSEFDQACVLVHKLLASMNRIDDQLSVIKAIDRMADVSCGD
jgi:hypothetical protein